MRKVNKPKFTSVEIFQKCISNYTDIDKVSRLLSYIDKIEYVSEEFDSKMQTTTIHTIEQLNEPQLKNDMKDVYDNKLVKAGQPGRDIYDILIAAPKFGLCPFCAQSQSNTLDHLLPKAKYPYLTVTPLNLIPSCLPCNKRKSESFPSSAEDEPLNPYYDDIESERWLTAVVKETIPPAIVFQVEAPSDWSTVKKKRVEAHFERFKLNLLFSANAAQQISFDHHSLYNVFITAGHGAGPNAVREKLLEYAESYEKEYANSWQVALYYGLANNNWFCTHGLVGIEENNKLINNEGNR